MATNIKIDGSFVPRGGIARDWAQAVNFVPAANELIVYSPDTTVYSGTGTAQGQSFTYESATYTRFKFGDGQTNVNLLPFVTTDPTTNLGVGETTSNNGEIFNLYEDTTVSGYGTVPKNKANSYAHAEGAGTEAYGQASHAEGRLTLASGNASHAEGVMAHAIGNSSHAEGHSTNEIYTIAQGTGSHGEGIRTFAEGDGSHSEGADSRAEGGRSHAEGNATYAKGYASHAEGSGNGSATTINKQTDYGAFGNYSHSEGNITKASGTASHAEGYLTEATGNYSHSEGYNTKATKDTAHAEGYLTEATEYYSHSEGYDTEATGKGAHAEGYKSVASGMYSHAAGYDTQATQTAQYVVGRYNSDNSEAYFIVGNGTASDRKNAFEVLKDGSAKVYTQGYDPESVVTKDYADQYFNHNLTAQRITFNPGAHSITHTLENLPVEILSNSGRIVFSNSYNLLKINSNIFNSTFPVDGVGYPSITLSGLTLYYKDNKLYLHGKYTSSNDYVGFNIGAAEFLAGLSYKVTMWGKEAVGTGVTTPVLNGALNITRGETSNSGYIQKQQIIPTSTVGNVTLNVSKGVEFTNEEIQILITCAEDNLFTEYCNYQVADSNNPASYSTITTYDNTTYVFCSSTCSFRYKIYLDDLIERDYATREYVDNRTPKIIVSTSEPTDKVEGMIWIKPVT